MNVTIFLLLLLCFTEGPSALAQSSLEGFSTGRYEIHKSTKSSRKPASAESDQATPVTDSEGVQVKVLSQAELAAEKSSAEKVAAGNGAKKVSEKSED
ncbi:MAG TPA: hypothetical protein VN132_06365, partial [Bdellovibrio sp.]|nr:hypothetical protein [Bdellovibrio sp.]